MSSPRVWIYGRDCGFDGRVKATKRRDMNISFAVKQHRHPEDKSPRNIRVEGLLDVDSWPYSKVCRIPGGGWF